MENIKRIIQIVLTNSKEHHIHYKTNEYAVRTQLIDPLLCALGWDISDPKIVKHNEKTEEKEIPDYVLYKDNKKRLIVEAKSLSVIINNSVQIKQLSSYCYNQSTDYGILTNGLKWLLFETYQREKQNRIVWCIDLEKDNIDNVINKLATLSFEKIDLLKDLTQKYREMETIWDKLQNNPSYIKDLYVSFIKKEIVENNISENEIKEFVNQKYEQIPITIEPIKKHEIIEKNFNENFVKPKKYKNVNDYLIPVINLIKRGESHIVATKTVARKLNVTVSTVNAQCTSRIGLKSIYDFVDLINNKEIKSYLKEWFPNEAKKIDAEL